NTCDASRRPSRVRTDRSSFGRSGPRCGAMLSRSSGTMLDRSSPGAVTDRPCATEPAYAATLRGRTDRRALARSLLGHMAARSFAPFRHQAFRLVWAGALVSNVGTWMETTALSYYVADTSTASASGLVAAAGFLPTAILGPLGGAWA